MKKNLFDIIVLLSFLFVSFLLCLINYDLPGVYLDAVNPDYLAMQIIRPHAYDIKWVMPFFGIPILGQLYHGTVTMFFQLPFLLILRNGSVLLLHFINSLYGSISCFFLYLLLKKLHVNRFVALGVAAMLILSLSLNTIYRIQYYIKLPGIMFTLIAMFFLFRADEKHRKNILLTGLFSGLAFYSYFIYIFFVPSFIISITLIRKWEKKELLRNIFLYLVSFLTGSYLYVVGYLNIFLSTLSYSFGLQCFLSLSFFVLGYIFLGYVLYGIMKYDFSNRKKFITYFSIVVSVGVAFIITILINLSGIISAIKAQTDSLSITTNGSFYYRIQLLISYTIRIIGNQEAEQLLFQTEISKYPNVLFYVILSVSAINLVILTFKRDVAFAKSTIVVLMFIVSFYLCSLVLISRMGNQHFVPILFMLFLLLGVGVDNILYVFRNNNVKKYVGYSLSIILLITCLVFNTINLVSFHKELNRTGGLHYFSSAINDLAYDANKRYNEGEYDIYIFEKWGFIFGFNYLTSNRVECSTYLNYEAISSIIGADKVIIICCFEESDVDYYINKLDELNIDMERTITPWYGRSGELVFYSIEIRK